jgi:hypothetical protein
MAQNVKTVLGVPIANVKTFCGVPIANCKTIMGVDNTGGGGGGTPFITSIVAGTPRNDFAGYVGFRFTVGAAGLSVTHLGRWVLSGNSGSHDLFIFEDDGSTLVATATLATSGKPADDWSYEAVSGGPVALDALTSYYCASQEFLSGDSWLNDNTVLTPSALGTVTNSAYGTPTPMGVSSCANFSFVPPNFLCA